MLQCLDLHGFINTLIFYMAVPLVLAVLFVLSAASCLLCKSRFTPTALLETAVPPLLKLAFLAYPLVTNFAFDAFSCYKFEDSQWLKADIDIECGTPKHDRARALAWAAIIFYALGLLALNASLLFAARRAILTNTPTTLSRATAFLYREYAALLSRLRLQLWPRHHLPVQLRLQACCGLWPP